MPSFKARARPLSEATNYVSGEDFVVEFLGYRFSFNAIDFEQRVNAAAVKLGLVESGELEEDETADLVELTAGRRHVAVERFVSIFGAGRQVAAMEADQRRKRVAIDLDQSASGEARRAAGEMPVVLTKPWPSASKRRRLAACCARTGCSGAGICR